MPFKAKMALLVPHLSLNIELVASLPVMYLEKMPEI